MNPVSAFGRLVGQAWKLRRDKAKAGNAGHACYLTGLSWRVRVKPGAVFFAMLRWRYSSCVRDELFSARVTADHERGRLQAAKQQR
jgi:hypothetical protein